MRSATSYSIEVQERREGGDCVGRQVRPSGEGDENYPDTRSSLLARRLLKGKKAIKKFTIQTTRVRKNRETR